MEKSRPGISGISSARIVALAEPSSHIMHFAPDMIYPYNPRQVVIYCGENDLVADTTLTAMDILNQTKQLINLIKATKSQKYLIISSKPSLARWNIRDKIKRPIDW